MLKFSQIAILIFLIIFALGLITLGLKMGANRAIAMVKEGATEVVDSRADDKLSLIHI